MSLRHILAFFSPGAIILLAAAVFSESGFLADGAALAGRIFPAAILGAALFLGLRFHRGRLIFAILALAAADRAMLHFAPHPGWGNAAARMVALLLPLNLLAVSLGRERGVFSAGGLLRFAMLTGQAGLAALLLAFCRPQVSGWLDYRLLTQGTGFPVLTQPAIVAWFVALLLMALIFWRGRQALDHGLFWGAVTALVPFAGRGGWGVPATFYMGTAGLIMLVAALEAAYSMAFRDELTGLPARRALNEAMQRLSSRYAVAMLDIDFFKKFNDRYGHDAGDQVLRMVAARIARVSGGGKPFRYGGEEFTILFPGRTSAEVLPHLETLRRDIAGTGFRIRAKGRPRRRPKKGRLTGGEGKTVPLTVSIGVAEAGERTGSPQEVVRSADQALYRAKKQGRNRVVR